MFYSNYLGFISLNYKNVEKEVRVDISDLPKAGRAKEWGLKKDTAVLSGLQTFLWAEISLQFSVSDWEQSWKFKGKYKEFYSCEPLGWRHSNF